jgi:multicomponent Na+:H+ antiporter subunit G
VSIHGWIAVGLCAVGFFFSLTGAIGIVRMPDVYTRIQCSSNTITMGAIPFLVALAVVKGPLSTYGSRALLVGLLLLIVNPAASHAVARAAYKTRVPMWPGSVVDEVRQKREDESG